MPHPSPYDLIHKASRHATATDRWAALKSNAQERIAVNPQHAEPPYAPPPQEQAPAQPPIAPRAQSLPDPIIPQPPFPPPQPRHPYLDEIASRHTQAIKSALEPREWNPRKPQEAPPAQQAAPAALQPAPDAAQATLTPRPMRAPQAAPSPDMGAQPPITLRPEP